MARSETVLEGTWEQLALHADELRGKQLRLTIVSEESMDSEEMSRDVEPQPRNLAEYLGDFIGSIAGSGAANSEDSGEKYAAALVQKHQDGCL